MRLFLILHSRLFFFHLSFLVLGGNSDRSCKRPYADVDDDTIRKLSDTLKGLLAIRILEVSFIYYFCRLCSYLHLLSMYAAEVPSTLYPNQYSSINTDIRLRIYKHNRRARIDALKFSRSSVIPTPHNGRILMCRVMF